MSEYSDFVGFQFNGHHSSDLGIKRTSNSNRYNETLVPTFKDTTVAKTNAHGTLYWNSFYSQKTWDIQIAFDELTETQIRKLRQVFAAEEIGDLVFDELPYKIYTAKIQSPIELKMLCFDREVDGVKQRVYKGEGSIKMIAYYPFARCAGKTLESFKTNTGEWKEQYKNVDEWKESSGIIESNSYKDITCNSTTITFSTTKSQAAIEIYIANFGDMEIPVNCYVTLPTPTNMSMLRILHYNKNIDSIKAYNTLTLKNITTPTTDETILYFDFKNRLISGATKTGDTYTLTSNLYNQYITSGDFTTLQTLTATSTTPTPFPLRVQVIYDTTYTTNITADSVKFEYDYLYY